MKKETVPIRNVGFYMVDVKRPGFSSTSVPKRNRIRLSSNFSSPLNSRKIGFKLPRIALISLALGVLVIVVVIFFGASSTKKFLAEKSARIFENFSLSIEALRAMDFNSAQRLFSENNEELSVFKGFLGGKEGSRFSLSSITKILPVFRDAGAMLKGVTNLNINLLALSEALADLKTNGFHYFQNNGSLILENINTIRGLIDSITKDVQSVRNSTANLKNVSDDFSRFDDVVGDEYIARVTELRSLNSFLSATHNLLASEADKHIALLFYNPSEIRPAGGFLGSYGVLSVKNGQMSNLEVGDIYWPDHPINFTAKIIPPEPLQSVTKDLGARDANWFFDFPTAAETTLGFFERSKVYKEKNIVFEGAIAININVLKSIIHVTGPVILPDYKLEINEENFLIELQREVEAGHDKKPGQNPKRILGVLAPILIDRVANLGDQEKASLFEFFGNHVKHKDIMFYSRDKNIASFFRDTAVDGSVYSLPSSFWGTYLAVVNSNIAGGKSDAFIKEKIEARIDIDSGGGSFVDLAITRSHHGQNEKDSWWRATNKDFIKIFTNLESSLGFIKGNDLTGKIYPLNYSGLGYEELPALKEIESTKKTIADYRAWSYEEFGKRVYATWFSVPAGKNKTLEMRYELPKTEEIKVAAGETYRVVFDRQSGVSNSLKVSVNAPLGYSWVESRSPVYIFESENPERRVLFDLTLTR